MFPVCISNVKSLTKAKNAPKVTIIIKIVMFTVVSDLTLPLILLSFLPCFLSL